MEEGFFFLGDFLIKIQAGEDFWLWREEDGNMTANADNARLGYSLDERRGMVRK